MTVDPFAPTPRRAQEDILRLPSEVDTGVMRPWSMVAGSWWRAGVPTGWVWASPDLVDRTRNPVEVFLEAFALVIDEVVTPRAQPVLRLRYGWTGIQDGPSERSARRSACPPHAFAKCSGGSCPGSGSRHGDCRAMAGRRQTAHVQRWLRSPARSSGIPPIRPRPHESVLSWIGRSRTCVRLSAPIRCSDSPGSITTISVARWTSGCARPSPLFTDRMV